MQSIDTEQSLSAGFPVAASSGRSRKLVFKLLLICASVAVGLGLCEALMRVFHLGRVNGVSRYNDKVLKFKPRASFMNYSENKNWVEINNLGFHDRDREAANSNYRILFVGDSFLEGRQVKTENLFTSRLEKRFTQAGQQVEVINSGVIGTGTAYHYELWKEFFEPNLKVDHLVLSFYMGNDLVDNNANLKRFSFPGTDHAFFLDSQGKILDYGTRPGEGRKLLNFVRDYSVLANTVYETAYKIKEGRAMRAEDKGNVEEKAIVGGVPENDQAAWEATVSGTIALIRKWKSELAAKNIPFDIVFIDRPGKDYNKFELGFLDTMPTMCAQNSIDCLHVKLDGDPYKFYSFDGKRLGHFNELGHATVADQLFDYFESRHRARLSKSTN